VSGSASGDGTHVLDDMLASPAMLLMVLISVARSVIVTAVVDAMANVPPVLQEEVCVFARAREGVCHGVCVCEPLWELSFNFFCLRHPLPAPTGQGNRRRVWGRAVACALDRICGDIGVVGGDCLAGREGESVHVPTEECRQEMEFQDNIEK